MVNRTQPNQFPDPIKSVDSSSFQISKNPGLVRGTEQPQDVVPIDRIEKGSGFLTDIQTIVSEMAEALQKMQEGENVNEENVEKLLNQYSQFIVLLIITEKITIEDLDTLTDKTYQTPKELRERIGIIREMKDLLEDATSMLGTDLDSLSTILFTTEQVSTNVVAMGKILEKFDVSPSRSADLVSNGISMIGIAGNGAILTFEQKLISKAVEQRDLLVKHAKLKGGKEKQLLEAQAESLDKWIQARKSAHLKKTAAVGLRGSHTLSSATFTMSRMLFESHRFTKFADIILPISNGLYAISAVLGVISAGFQVHQCYQQGKVLDHWSSGLQGEKKINIPKDSKEELSTVVQEQAKLTQERVKQHEAAFNEVFESMTQEKTVIQEEVNLETAFRQELLVFIGKDKETIVEGMKKRGFDIEQFYRKEYDSLEKKEYTSADLYMKEQIEKGKFSSIPRNKNFKTILLEPYKVHLLSEKFKSAGIYINEVNETLIASKKDPILTSEDFDREEVKEILLQHFANNKNAMGNQVKNALRTMASVKNAQLGKFLNWSKIKAGAAVVLAVVGVACAILSIAAFPPSLIAWIGLGAAIGGLIILGMGITYDFHNNPNLSKELYSWRGFISIFKQLNRSIKQWQHDLSVIEKKNREALYSFEGVKLFEARALLESKKSELEEEKIKKLEELYGAKDIDELKNKVQEHQEKLTSEYQNEMEKRNKEIQALKEKIDFMNDGLRGYENAVRKAAWLDYELLVDNKEIFKLYEDFPATVIKILSEGNYSREDISYIKQYLGIDLEGLDPQDTTQVTSDIKSLMDDFLSKSLPELKPMMKRA